jgi:hypothetical protein
LSVDRVKYIFTDLLAFFKNKVSAPKMVAKSTFLLFVLRIQKGPIWNIF